MGYRSNLYIKVTKPHLPALYTLLIQHDFISCSDLALDDDYFYVQLSDLKWYDSYPDVIAINSFINSLPSGEGAMIREGEESGDIEEYNEPHEVDLYPRSVLKLDGFEYSSNFKQQLKFDYPELLV